MDTTATAMSWRQRLVVFGLAAAVATAVNLALLSSPLWQSIRRHEVELYVANFDPVAVSLPNNMAPPSWAAGRLVVIGASNVGLGVPQEETAAMFGERAWTLWAAGLNPPEMLGLAPKAVEAGSRQALLALAVHYAAWGADTDFARENREVYVGPLNPAWPYRVELDHPSWSDVVLALPAFRLRSPLRHMGFDYLDRRILGRQLPQLSVWRDADATYRSMHVQQALQAWREDPTLANYERYQNYTLGTNYREMLFWQKMRRVKVDPTLQCPNIRALRDLTRYLRAHDIRVTWALFPENPMYGKLPADDGKPVAPPDIVADARTVLQRLAAEDGVPYLDLYDLCAPDDFLDLFHLAPPGREKLGHALRPLLNGTVPPPAPPPAAGA